MVEDIPFLETMTDLLASLIGLSASAIEIAANKVENNVKKSDLEREALMETAISRLHMSRLENRTLQSQIEIQREQDKALEEALKENDALRDELRGMLDAANEVGMEVKALSDSHEEEEMLLHEAAAEHPPEQCKR